MAKVGQAVKAFEEVGRFGGERHDLAYFYIRKALLLYSRNILDNLKKKEKKIAKPNGCVYICN